MGFSMVNSMTGSIRLLEEGAKARARLAMESMADDIRESARYNAPWADRTGEAREGLDVDVSEEDGDIVLSLYHTVEYGEWLEVIQSGRFAIIMPTLELYADQVFDRAGADFLGRGIDS